MLVYQFEGVPRNPLTVALKNVLTLGLHTKVWLYRVNREMDGRESFHIHLGRLAVMLWVPFVTPAIVKFQTAHRLNQMVSDPVTIPLIRARRLGWISLIPIFGAGFYAYWVQSSLNKFWFWHRRKERYQLNVEKIKQIAQEPESEAMLNKRFALEQDCRRIEREMEEEIEAARLRWGEERFLERKKRAEMHAERGRLTRKEAARLRKAEKERRKAQRARRRMERSVIARYKPRRADPEKDELWRPVTPKPQRSPEEIEAAAKNESRELSRKEERELKRAHRLIAVRDKETQRLEKRRAKLLARKQKKEERLNQRAEKKKAAVQKKQRKKRGEKEPKAKPAGGPRRRFGVLSPRRDPEVDEHWEPKTPEPKQDPDELADAIETEGRSPTKKESKQMERAEALLEKREKEAEKLALAREKARVKAQQQAEAEESKREKKRGKSEGKDRRQKAKDEAKQEKALAKKEKTPKAKKEKKGKAPKEKKPKGKKEKPTKENRPKEKKEKSPKKRQVKPKPPEKGEGKPPSAPAPTSSQGAVKVLRVRCPQCGTGVPVKKPDDRPARLKCPSCGLVGKV